MEEKPNLTYIDNLAGDDQEFKAKFIEIIKQEFPVEVETYIGHIKSDEPRAAAEIVHKLKHKFNILSMENAYRFSVNYEEDLRRGSMKMNAHFLNILQNITSYLKTI